MTKVNQLANNQFIITENNGNEIFQSYDSIIAKKSLWAMGTGTEDRIELDQNYWDYSKTTSKYRNKFLDETTKETQAKIKSGEYILTDLNQ